MRTPILRLSSYRPRISYFSFQGNACWQERVYALGGCAKVFRGASRLSESEHGPLFTYISLLRTPLLSKPHIGP